MNLKDFLASRDSPPELFWSLVLEPGWVQAGIWYIGEGAAEVLYVSPPTAWETDDELIGAVDAALSSSVQNLPENYSEPNKTVFGVPSIWVKNGEIGEEYLAKIKQVCADLSLTPVGFVVLPEAIAHLYKSEEGVPLNAITIGLGEETLEVSVFKLGNLGGTTQVARSVSLIDDISEGLTRFEGAGPLPSRFVVYDGKGGELAEAKEEILRADWSGKEKIRFLHAPKVEILAPERKVLATSLAGALEIGHVSRISASDTEPLEKVERTPVRDDENVTEPKESISAEELGFAVNEDISLKKAPRIAEAPVVEKEAPIQSGHISRFNTARYLEKTKNLFHAFSGLFVAKTALPPSVSGKKGMVLGITALVIVMAGLLAWWFLPKAVVSIYVSPKKFSQDVTLKFSTNGTSDPGSGIIPAQTLSTEVNGDKTKATTGTKLVGNKATGTVQIANGSPVAIDLPAGTTIISSGSLNFTIDSEASVSGQILPGQPGNANVNVTASDIGAQYNLAKGEVFSVGNYLKAQVAATATKDFSGGSSQQISAVSADDEKNLEDSLKNELSQNAISNLSGKVGDRQVFVNDLSGLDIKTETFDHQIGDQADTLKLSLDVNTTGVAADKDKLYEYARNFLKDKIPAGYALRDSQINFKFTFQGEDKKAGTLNYKATISANFLPSVNSDEIISKIAGKTTDVAENYLTVVQGFARAGITLKPALPLFFGTLPHVGKNITIEVVAE